MNNGLYGFPPGKNITVDVKEYERTDVWTKPPNAKVLFLEGTGAGQAGTTATTAGAVGGSAGVAYQLWIEADAFDNQVTVVIGSGGVPSAGEGGQTSFGKVIWMGGRNAATPRQAYTGTGIANSWAGGGAAGAGGKVGSFGAGGGGGGGANTGQNGGAGGKPRSFEFASGVVTAALGGGAAGGTIATGIGSSASALNDIDGFGEGGGGGYGSSTGTGNNGGAGRRGSGGGGGGGGIGGGGTGGKGGDGFLRVITYCWE